MNDDPTLSQKLIAEALAAIPPCFDAASTQEIDLLLNALHDILRDAGQPAGGIVAAKLLGEFLQAQLAPVALARHAAATAAERRLH
jgi:hypothetical protein